MTTATNTYTCPYCRQASESVATSCPWCGAPVDVTVRTTSGGWTGVRPIAAMTRLQAGQSSVQIEGGIAAVADWSLAAGDGLYFPHQALLWQEPSIRLSQLPLSNTSP